MTRIFNFCAGPGNVTVFPCLEKARDELLDFTRVLGMSVMEISAIAVAPLSMRLRKLQTEACLRRLMSISDDYAVSVSCRRCDDMQFAQVPLNLAAALTGSPGAYIVDGSWSKKAFVTAQRMGLARVGGQQLKEVRI